MKEELINLLDKYYRGETSHEEELSLKNEILASEEKTPECDIFNYYASGLTLPERTEESLFDRIEEKPKRKGLQIKIYSMSAAAFFLLLVTLFLGYQQDQKAKKDFKTMEQALSLVSESLQPEEEEPEMLVLWVDNNVEVIIN